MKKLRLFLLALCLVFALTGCACEHEWQPETCTAPTTCAKCGQEAGVAPGHVFQEADCLTPRTCSICGFEEGQAPGHAFAEADCLNPRTCTVCAATEGEALGHTYGNATCEEPAACIRCGIPQGEALGHDFGAPTCDTPATCSRCPATQGDPLGHAFAPADCFTPMTCTVCGHIEGDPLGHTYGVWQVGDDFMIRACEICETEETSDIVLSAGLRLTSHTLMERFPTVFVPADWKLDVQLDANDPRFWCIEESEGHVIIASAGYMGYDETMDTLAQSRQAASDWYVNVRQFRNKRGATVITYEDAAGTSASVLISQENRLYTITVTNYNGVLLQNAPVLVQLRDDIAEYLYFK
ncbi:MAG: hypothetical protein J6K72_06040 [Clostridia bacterium]|nr:hypothetical protein [Clostridia bacterium]